MDGNINSAGGIDEKIVKHKNEKATNITTPEASLRKRYSYIRIQLHSRH